MQCERAIFQFTKRIDNIGELNNLCLERKLKWKKREPVATPSIASISRAFNATLRIVIITIARPIAPQSKSR